MRLLVQLLGFGIVIVATSGGGTEVKGRLFLPDDSEDTNIQEKTHNHYAGWGQNQQYGGGASYLVDADAKTDVLGTAVSGLSSLSWITKGIVAIVFFPLLLVPLAFIALIIYFIPVLRIELGPNAVGRKWSPVGPIWSHLEGTARFFSSIPTEEECMEKVVCETARAAPLHSNIFSWFQLKMEGSENWALKRLGRSLRMASEGNCGLLKCRVKRQFDYFSKWIPFRKAS